MSLGALHYSCSLSLANHSSWYIRFPPKFQFKWYQKWTVVVHGSFLVLIYLYESYVM